MTEPQPSTPVTSNADDSQRGLPAQQHSPGGASTNAPASSSFQPMPDAYGMAKRRRELRQELLAAVTKSVTSAHSSGRTVDDPAKAAEYVVNMLTVHNQDLLWRVATEFVNP